MKKTIVSTGYSPSMGGTWYSTLPFVRSTGGQFPKKY